jgi:AbiJ N-terminal domain 4
MRKLNFAQRVGVSPIKSIQVNSIDDDLRNTLWNAFYQIYEIVLLDKGTGRLDISCNEFFRIIWKDFLHRQIDTISDVPKYNMETIKKYFYEGDWVYPYMFVEFLVSRFDDGTLQKFFNKILERECSGYRFIDGVLSPIIEEQDMQEIKTAIQDEKYAGASIHIKEALRMLSDREKPDYRGSIVESIFAVEYMARTITGKPKATLGEALKEIGNIIKVHPSLVEGFKKIYGYRNDEGGLGHSFIEDSDGNFTQADARYFLVSCSAFVNYLKELFNKE